MQEVRRVLKLAAMRLLLTDFLRLLSITLTAGLVGAILARIAEKTFGVLMPWKEIAIYGSAGVVASAALWALVRRPREKAVAQTVDERANLKEALSTSLYVEKTTDGWARNVVEGAVQAARRVNVAQAVPIEAPRRWPVPVASAFALLLVWVAYPKLDIWGKDKERLAQEEKKQQVIQVKNELEVNQAKLNERLKNIAPEFVTDPSELGKDQKPEGMDPDALRRAEVKKLTDLSTKLEQMKESEKAAEFEALKDAMRQLKQPGPGPLDEFTRSLSRGDFSKAKEQLEQMSKQLAEGDMSAEQKEQAKKQFENLSKQMEKLGDQQQQVAKQLEQSGLDRKTAEELAKKASSGDPEQLKQALEQMQNLSEEQKQELMKMAEQAMKTASQCQGMSEGLGKMAQGMSQEGMQQEGMEGMEAMAAELSEAEMLASDMENLNAALEEAKAQLAQLGQCMGGQDGMGGQCEGNGVGSWRQGSSQNAGNGSGGPGRGNGPSPESQAADFTTEKVKANVKTGQGPIIGSRLVYGQQVKGESKAEFSAAIEAGERSSSDSIDTMLVERELQDAVKTYFGKLQAKVKTEKLQETPAKEEGAK